MIVDQKLSRRISATATRETVMAVRYDTALPGFDKPAELVDTTDGKVVYRSTFRNILKIAKSELGLIVPMWQNLV
jgi:hypothetical protein